MRNSPYSINQKTTFYKLVGSCGYVREYDVEKYWRDSKIIQLCEKEGNWAVLTCAGAITIEILGIEMNSLK
jgi:hypothetical protein